MSEKGSSQNQPPVSPQRIGREVGRLIREMRGCNMTQAELPERICISQELSIDEFFAQSAVNDVNFPAGLIAVAVHGIVGVDLDPAFATASTR
jgi:hypothetical protein